jgi:hypothetical protein
MVIVIVFQTYIYSESESGQYEMYRVLYSDIDFLWGCMSPIIAAAFPILDWFPSLDCGGRYHI